MSNSNSCDIGMKRIEFTVNRTNDDVAEIKLLAESDNFLAQGSAYFSLRDLSIRARGFKNYPISVDKIPSITSGFVKYDGTGLVEECVHVSVRPVNLAGKLIMTVKLFTPDNEYFERGFGHGGHCDYILDYEGLREFADKLERLALGEIDFMKFENFN